MARQGKPAGTTPPRWDLDFDALAHDLAPLGNAKRLRLLNFLTLPRYLEEIASFLAMNRYAARKHVEQLVEAGVVARAPAKRPKGLVVEYRVVPEKLFELFDAMRALGTLRPADGADPQATLRTKPMTQPPRRGPASGDTARFVLVYAVHLGAVMPLASAGGRASWTIGRDPGCELRLDADPFVSGRHVQVERRGAYQVTDLFSRNGTTLDWERLEPGQAKPLANGQVLGVGKTLMLFRGA